MKTSTNANPFMPQNQSAMNAAQNAPMLGGNFAGGTNATFDIDLTNVQTGFVIPDGKYRMSCADVEQGVSKANNPQFIWTFTVMNGDYVGREFKYFTALTPAAMWKVAETVTALGLGVVGQKIKFTRSEVQGRQCIAVIEESEYNGQVRSSITSLEPVE